MTDLDALKDAATLAQDAADRAETARIMAALNAEARARRNFDLTKITEIAAAPDLDEASPAAVLLAVRHLGARPPSNPTAVLADLAALTALSPEAMTTRLRQLAQSPRAAGLLARINIYADRNVVCVLGGLVLGQVSA